MGSRVEETTHLYHYVTCFIVGATTLILEVLGFRLFAPYFGYSVYVSGTLVGVVLLFMSVGYYLGGRLADNKPTDAHMYAAILCSAAYLVAFSLVQEPILRRLQNVGLITGTIIGTGVMYAVPITLLSIVAPYVIKLVSRHDSIGASAGAIFALSTLGSIIGTFLATFLLIPFLGSRRTLAICIALLLAVSVVGLARTSKKYLLLSLLALTFVIPPYKVSDPNKVYETESFYNLIRIYDNNGLEMMLNNPNWRQSYKPDVNRLEHTYREYFNLAPYLTPVHSILVLGMSAGASAMELKHFFDVTIDAVEIDPEVVRLAKEYFGVKEDASFRIYTQDAKNFVTTTRNKYDFVEVDLFHGGPEIPFYVATREFVAQLYELTTDHGLVMMNLIGGVPARTSKNSLVGAVANTVSTVFPSVFLFEKDGSTILMATKNATKPEELTRNLDKVTQTELAILASEMKAGLQVYTPEPEGMILTDDRAPVEYLIYQIVKTLS